MKSRFDSLRSNRKGNKSSFSFSYISECVKLESCKTTLYVAFRRAIKIFCGQQSGKFILKSRVHHTNDGRPVVTTESWTPEKRKRSHVFSFSYFKGLREKVFNTTVVDLLSKTRKPGYRFARKWTLMKLLADQKVEILKFSVVKPRVSTSFLIHVNIIAWSWP